jgi:hypothetical protein
MNFHSTLNLAICLILVGGGVRSAAADPQPGAQPSAGDKPATPPPPATPAAVATPRPKPIPAPFVSAKTNMVSSKTVVEPGALSIGGLTLSQTQLQREMSVSVSVKFFAPLPGPFEVQCFFLAKNDATRSRYIFNVVQEEAKRATFDGEMHSGTVLGATGDWIAIPLALPESVPPDGGKAVDATGKGITADTKSASKIEGWVLRVVYGGRVLKVDSNQPHLAELANRLPVLFDVAAKAK